MSTLLSLTLLCEEPRSRRLRALLEVDREEGKAVLTRGTRSLFETPIHPSAWKVNSGKLESAVEDAHRRHYQDHAENELEHRSRDHSHEEAPAPITDPAPIGATVRVRSARYAEEPRLL